MCNSLHHETTCPICKTGTVAVGFDKCANCMKDEYKCRIRKKLYDVLIPPRYRNADISLLPSYLQNALANAKDGRGVLLYGSVGSGKTFAMYAFVKYCIDADIDVAVTSYSNLCLSLRNSFSAERNEDEYAIMKRYSDVCALCLDDIGVSKSNEESEFSTRVLRTIIDNRYNNLKSTVLTSNKSAEELGKSFDDRISSRILGSCTQVLMSGKDRRSL